MPSIRFFLEKRKNSHGVLNVKNVPLLMSFTYNGNRLIHYTGYKIDYDHWDVVNERTNSSLPEFKELNAHLDDLKKIINAVYEEIAGQGNIPKKSELKKAFKDQLKNEKISFFDCYITFIEKNINKWTISTYRKVKTNYNHLRNFAAANNYNLTFTGLNNNFFREYYNYFIEICNHKESTINKNLNILHWFLNWAYKNNYLKSNDFKKFIQSHIVRVNEGSKNLLISLSVDEVLKIYQTKLSSMELDLARDLFCFSCYTGLRLNELHCILKSHVYEKKIKVKNRKGQDITVPLTSVSGEIVDKYRDLPGNKLFPYLYSQKINQLIKEVGEIAGINEMVAQQEIKNKKLTRVTRVKFLLLNMETARRSFICNAILLGIPYEVIIGITGHQSVHSLEGYKNLLENQKITEMKKFEQV